MANCSLTRKYLGGSGAKDAENAPLSRKSGKYCQSLSEYYSDHIPSSGNRICCRLGRQQVGTAGENRFGSQTKPNPLGPGGRNRSGLEYAHKKCVKDYAPRLLIRCIPPHQLQLAPTQVHASSTQTRVCLISPWRGTCRNTRQPCRARRGRCARRRACRTPSCPPRSPPDPPRSRAPPPPP